MTNKYSARGSVKGDISIAKTTVEWCAKKLLPRFRTLDIEVIFKKFGDGTHAECHHIGGNEFKIHIQKGMKIFDLMITGES